MTVVPSGSNTDLFRPMDRNKCLEKRKLKKENQYIGFVGSLLKYQGVNILIEAAPLVIAKIPRAHFIIIGEGPMREEWVNTVKKKGLTGKFTFTGQIDYKELPGFIGCMDICEAPFMETVGYSSPVKIFDYMSCGRPIIASDVDGTTGVFRYSEAVHLVPPESPDALARSIIKIIDDEKLLKHMGAMGRKFALEKYDRKKLVNRIDRILLSL